jgi:asparagine synthase (glutamine-hydrolysing)
MNPFQYWYDTDERLRNFVATYWQENHHLLNGHEELEAECRTLFYSHSAFDKLLVVSLVHTLHVYFQAQTLL